MNLNSTNNNIPQTIENEDINISPFENMIFDFDNIQNSNTINFYIYYSLPLKGNIFPYIEKKLFNKNRNKRKIIDKL